MNPYAIMDDEEEKETETDFEKVSFAIGSMRCAIAVLNMIEPESYVKEELQKSISYLQDITIKETK